VPFGFLVVPFLVAGLPDLALAAAAADKRLIDIVLRQRAVGVDVGEFAGIGGNRRRVRPALRRRQPRDTLGLAPFGDARVAAGVGFARQAYASRPGISGLSEL
jgi:hypothetical protein